MFESTTDQIVARIKDFLEFNLGDIVYLKTDKEQNSKMVVSINLNFNGITYLLCEGSELFSSHFAQEITSEKTIY